MRKLSSLKWSSLALALVIGACSHMGGMMQGSSVSVALSGAQEVPPVMTAAKGSGTVTIGEDMSVKGMVTTSGFASTAAHIHMAPAGKNGPVVVPMVRSGADGWTFAPGAKLNDEQMKAFKEGNLYINVHSAAHPGGEIRAQLKP